MVCSDADAGSGVPGELRAAFSAATIDRGRLLGRSEDCEVGRLCHDRVDRAEGMPMEGEVMDMLVRLMSDSDGESFSLVGELEESVALSMFSAEGGAARGRGLPVLSRPGEARLVPSEAEGRMPTRWEEGDGVFAGDDFWGEIDLARSAGTSTLSALSLRHRYAEVMPTSAVWRFANVAEKMNK